MSWPLWNAMISLMRCWRRRISRARISMSAAVPSNPPAAWWIMMRRVGQRVPLALGAAAEQHRAHDAAIPTQVVETSGWISCIVS